MNKQNNITNLTKDTGSGSCINLSQEDVFIRKNFLDGIMIGISISESDNLNEMGYGVTHLKDLIIEVAKYIIASGGSIGFGGDIRRDGFTELIFDLLVYYKVNLPLPPSERFYSYLAFPISTTLTTEKEAELRHMVSFKKILPPDNLGIKNDSIFLEPDSPENKYIWARCLTKMREEMELECHARIFIGGRVHGYRGKCPGVLEELMIALKHKHPVYIVGSFGGVSQQIIYALLDHEKGDLFNLEFHKKEYKEIHDFYSDTENETIDFRKYFPSLKNIGVKGISENNGLTEAENLRLFTTPHINEIVFLILKGLTNCFKKN